jgi:hypothetical protein
MRFAVLNWEKHDGITRGVVEEGQQHFKTTEQAVAGQPQ